MRTIAFLLSLLLCLASVPAHAAEAPQLRYTVVPDVIRPGKYYDIKVESASAGSATLSLLSASGEELYAILSGYPLAAGSNSLVWNGLRVDQRPVEPGEYLLRLVADGGASVENALRVGAPYPLLTDVFQSDSVFTGAPIDVAFEASEPGTLIVGLRSHADGQTLPLSSMDVAAGENTYMWDGTVNGAPPPDGAYSLQLTLRTSGGAESLEQNLHIDVALNVVATPEPETPPVTEIEQPVEPSHVPLAAQTSTPYSTIEDGSFWSMTPGETDDAVIWDILMQPITVYDGGIKAGAKGHTYMMENPDGTGKQVAQLHSQSQGLHVIGEVNEHGYVLVEAFSNYDREYSPADEYERQHAFDLRQGYVLAKNLKTVDVMTDMALLIDKKTQRMYLYKDGVRVTEFLIATGIVKKEKDTLFETIPGEFITVSHAGTLTEEGSNMLCDLAIRINGGVLIHEVPHKERKDGTKDYSSFEGYLGTKQSHGCIRVQRLKNEDGYNMRWIWDNFKRAKPYKVIIWDDLNRVDEPGTWYPNPKN